MNVIETLKDILQGYPKIAEVCDEIHVDFNSAEPTSYGLSSMGDTLLEENIVGDQRRQHSFMLYCSYSAYNDYERLCNTGALLELSQWLSMQSDISVTHTVLDQSFEGKITGINTENGMLINIPQENAADAVQYQLQIIVKYTLERS